jgi:predicted PurR-regulated permease PerM
VNDPIITEKQPASRWPRWLFLSVSAAVVVGVVVLAHEVMLPFVLAAVIAYVLWPAVEWVEKKKVPRGLAIVLVYAVVLGSLGVFIRLTAPRIGMELGSLRRELPSIAAQAKKEWIPSVQEKLRSLGLAPPPKPPEPPPSSEEPSLVIKPRPDGSYAVDVGSGLAVYPTRDGGYTIEEIREEKAEQFDPNKLLSDVVGKTFAYAQHNTLELARIGRDIIASVSRFFFVFGITLMLAAYMMLTRERILGFFTSLVRPTSRPSLQLLLWRVDKGLSGVVRGQLIICLVNGVLSAIGFAIVGLKYWPVLALIATVFSLVPIFGSILSAIPAVALGLTQSFGTALFVLGWIIGIHQLEANLLNPKIMGDQAKIHPVLVIFSLLVGEHFFHTAGALLAVPCMSIAQSLFIHFRHVVQSRDPEMAHEQVASMPPPPDPKRGGGGE